MQSQVGDMDAFDLSASEIHVLRVAANTRRGALIDQVADECGLSRNAAQVRLRALRRRGLLTVPSMRWAGQVKYRATERGRRALAQLARTPK
jgi:predicted ArsR family transcriptional regulator